MNSLFQNCDKLERYKVETNCDKKRAMRTYHFQDFNETLAEEWKDNGHNRLIFFRYFIHYGPEDPVGGADGHPNKVENHHPFGALLEALDLTPSLWHLEP